MNNISIGESEYRFMELVWENEPLKSGALVKLCDERFQWKKSTTYTTLKRLINKGIVQNENSVVSSLVPREQIQKQESNDMINKTFNGSLPSFMSAFFGNHKLSKNEAAELIKMIEENTENE